MSSGPMMDINDDPSGGESSNSIAVHRVRFVDWKPSAVTSIALLPGDEASTSRSRSIMAVGHENGNVDICLWAQDESIPSTSSIKVSSILPKGWVVDTTLMGAAVSKIDSLAFAYSASEDYMRKPRLFSTSGGSIITEHILPPHIAQMTQDTNRRSTTYLEKGKSSIHGTSRIISSQGGAVWSMAASPLGRYLAIGCEDGYVRIIDIRDDRFELLESSQSARRAGDGSIQGVVSNMDRAKTRIVSVAWGPPTKMVSTQTARKSPTKSDSSDSSSDESDDDEDDWQESFILGGTTQSSALKWSASTGRIVSKMLVEKSRKEQTIVWSVAILADGTLVLGDSLGHVSFFDGKTHTLLPGARFNRHGKGADVLTLCVGPDGKTVYSAGLDQKINEYTLIGANAEVSKQMWICTASRRLHAHDIRALAVDPPFSFYRVTSTARRSEKLPILISGGSDFNLVYTPASSPSQVAPLKASIKKQGKVESNRFDEINPISASPFTTFADTIQRRVPFVPSTSRGGALGGGGVVRICAAKRWIMLRRETSLAFWRLSKGSIREDVVDIDSTDSTSWSKILEMQVKLKSNIVSAEISSDGKYLVVADLYETKLFAIEETGLDIVPIRIKSFSKVMSQRGVYTCPGSSAITFTPENSRVILATYPGSFIHVIELSSASQNGDSRLLKTFDQHRKRISGRAMAGRNGISGKPNGHPINGINGNLHDDESTLSDEDNVNGQTVSETDDYDERTRFARIDLLQVSPDGQYLVSSDTSKRIHTFSLDTLHYHSSLPSTPLTPCSISFDQSRTGRICLLLPTNQILIYNLEDRNDQVAKQGDDDLAQAIMHRISTIRESAIGSIWLSPSKMIIWGSTWICTARAIDPKSIVNGHKAKRSRAVEINPSKSISDVLGRWNIMLTFKYQPLLYVGLIPCKSGSSSVEIDELVVIERPYYDIAPSLPPSWFSGSRYGT